MWLQFMLRGPTRGNVFSPPGEACSSLAGTVICFAGLRYLSRCHELQALGSSCNAEGGSGEGREAQAQVFLGPIQEPGWAPTCRGFPPGHLLRGSELDILLQQRGSEPPAASPPGLRGGSCCYSKTASLHSVKTTWAESWQT